jgi:hypothetical protein
MATNGSTKEHLPISTGQLTAAGVVALLGALLLGAAALIGSNAVMSAVREWVNAQDVPPTESAKSMIRVLHNAALAGTTAGAEAWKNEISSTSTD